MKSFLGSFLGAMLGIVLLGVLGIVFLIGYIAFSVNSLQNTFNKKADLAENIILELNINTKLVDQPVSSFDFFNDAPLSLIELTQGLKKAKTDPRVIGIFLRVHAGAITLGTAKPLQLALKDFKASGKPVIFFTASAFDDTSIAPYWLASEANEIWMQKHAAFMTTGIMSNTSFFADFLQKVGVEAEFEQFKEYKNAANVFTKNHLTPAHKEAQLSFLGNLWEQAINDITERRPFSREHGIEILKNVPYSAEEALNAGLIDGVGFYSDLKEELIKNIENTLMNMEENSSEDQAIKPKVTFTSLKKYFKSAGTPYTEGPVIALVYGQGKIISKGNDSPYSIFEDNTNITGYAMTRALNAASKDKNVRAIILRLNTPGGDATPSEEILHAVSTAQKRGKPVIISMGPLAASGGYYIASRADKIIALPSTLTGSIGVFGGKFVVGKTVNKIGINVETVDIGGPMASFYSGFEKFTPQQRTALKKLLKNVYNHFILHVSEGRELSPEKTEELAKGRVWTGMQAQKLGLVDELGGLEKAIDIAKELANIEKTESITLKRFPHISEKDFFRKLFQGDLAKNIKALRTFSAFLENPDIQQAIQFHKRIKKQHGVMLYNPDHTFPVTTQ